VKTFKTLTQFSDLLLTVVFSATRGRQMATRSQWRSLVTLQTYQKALKSDSRHRGHISESQTDTEDKKALQTALCYVQEQELTAPRALHQSKHGGTAQREKVCLAAKGNKRQLLKETRMFFYLTNIYK
jgi:hypothetical protein